MIYTNDRARPHNSSMNPPPLRSSIGIYQSQEPASTQQLQQLFFFFFRCSALQQDTLSHVQTLPSTVRASFNFLVSLFVNNITQHFLSWSTKACLSRHPFLYCCFQQLILPRMCPVHARCLYESCRPGNTFSNISHFVPPRYYITLHYIKSYLECPKSLRTARTLYEIKGVMWEYSYVGKHLEKR